MNCYTRKEKMQMAIDDIMTKVKMAVEITVIIAGFMAIGAICFMNQRMTAMEKELNYYKENYVQEQETKLQIVDTVTGRVIYEE
jgi:hypothetical protein